MAIDATDRRVPWHVRGIEPARDLASVEHWRYVVIEEVLDGVAVLRCWHWPAADDLGHLVWPAEVQDDATAVPVRALREQLYDPNTLRREPRIGDTFALVSDSPPGRWPRRTGDLARVLTGRVFDISAEARVAGRLAYRGSLAAIEPAPPGPGTSAPEQATRSVAAPELTVHARATRTGRDEP